MFLCLCAFIAGDIGAAPAHYRCTLKSALSGNRAVVLMLEVEDGRVDRHALMIGSRADTVQRMREHRLKVEDGRLTGPIEVWTGFVHEKFDLDVPLGKDGTYQAHYGCPEGTRKVDGKATVEFPKDPKAKRHVIWLRGAMGPKTTLGLVLNLDRAAKTVEGVHGWARGYNQGHHVLDTKRLAFDGAVLDGEVGIRVVDAPKHKLPIEGMIKMKVDLKAGAEAGEYSAVFGIDKTRPGEVVMERVSATDTQAVLSLLAPPIDPRTPWRGCFVVGPHLKREAGKLKQVIRWGHEKALDPATVKPEESGYSGMPDADWMKPEKDVSFWPRYQAGELEEYLGGYGAGIRGHGLWPPLLCLRTRFGVSDPAKANDLAVTVECIRPRVVPVGAEVEIRVAERGGVRILFPEQDFTTRWFSKVDRQDDSAEVFMPAGTNKTRTVARDVLRMILRGTYSPGDRIPAERDMARRGGVSRVTVRRAYDELEKAGILERRQGHGTRVATTVHGHTADIREGALLTAGIGPFGAAFLRALEQEVSAMDALLVLKTSDGQADREETEAVDLVAKGIRNLVIWPSGAKYRRETFERLRVVGTNMVFFDRIRPGPIADFVGLDNRDAVRRLLEHGRAAGCGTFHFVGYENGVADSERERAETFDRWCSQQGVRHASFRVPWGPGTVDGLLKSRRSGLGRGRTTAIICGHDELALHAREILGGGARLYGIDGYPEAVEAGITTFRQPLSRMARSAFRLLRQQQSKGSDWRAREVRCRGRLVAAVPGGAS